MTRPQLQFGLTDAIPEGVATAYGARWIISSGVVDVVWDRQSTAGPDVDRLTTALDRGILKTAIANTNRLLVKGHLTPRDTSTVVLFEDKDYVVKANPRASGGYLYVCAYEKPLVSEFGDVTGSRESDRFGVTGTATVVRPDGDDGCPVVRVGDVEGLWSYRATPTVLPQIGERANFGHQFGHGTVVAYFKEGAYVGVEVRLEVLPEWIVKQIAAGRRKQYHVLLFGVDIVAPKPELTPVSSGAAA